MDLRASQAILEENDDVPGYVRFHKEKLDDDAWLEIFGRDRATVDNAAFLARLDLVGVAVHAKPPESFSVVLDYSIGRAHTDQILGVTFDPKGYVVEVSHDS